MNVISKKTLFAIIVLMLCSCFDLVAQQSDINFAYVSVLGKDFSKKLKVKVDLGESEQQIKIGEFYSEKLTNTKSYATVLNFMDRKGFELIETIMLQSSYSYQGTGGGGVEGIVFVMKIKEESKK